MKRLQIHIEEELDDVLAVEAHRQRTSKAALIREAVAAQYANADDGTAALMRMAGMLKGGSPDGSMSVNDVVYRRP